MQASPRLARNLSSIIVGIAVLLTTLFLGADLRAQGNWTELTPLPTPSEGMASGRVGDTIIAAYGYAPLAGGDSVLTRLFDIDTNSWHMGANAPGPVRSEEAYGEGAFDGMLYVAGGRCSDASCPGGVTAAVERYDPVNNTWAILSPMTTPRAAAAEAFVQGKLYVIGGRSVGGGPCTGGALSTVERYDIQTDTWTTVASLPSARSDLAAVAHGGKIYVFGGCNSSSGYLNNVDVYDPNTNTWSPLQSMPTARASLVADVVGNLIFAIGGINPTKLAINEVYNIAHDKWVSDGANDLALRAEADAVSHGGKVYVIGGGPYGDSVNVNDAFVPTPIGYFNH